MASSVAPTTAEEDGSEIETIDAAEKLKPTIKIDRTFARQATVVPSATAKLEVETVTEIPVGISCRVRRTFALDNITQTYGVNLHVIMAWEVDEVADGKVGVGLHWEPEWKPNWIIKNVMEVIDHHSMYSLQANPQAKMPGRKPSIAFCESKSIVKIYQGMDLHRFPFDAQT